MRTPSYEAKMAYWVKARQSNYAASLRLEGFGTTRSDATRKLPTRAAVLNTYRKVKA